MQRRNHNGSQENAGRSVHGWRAGGTESQRRLHHGRDGTESEEIGISHRGVITIENVPVRWRDTVAAELNA